MLFEDEVTRQETRTILFLATSKSHQDQSGNKIEMDFLHGKSEISDVV